MNTKNNFPNLFQPGQIGTLTTKNRIVFAPMGTGFAELDGRFSQQHIDYFVARAKGGAGLILTEPVLVDTKISPLDRVLTAMDSDRLIPRASDLVDAVHDYGAKIGVQIGAGAGKYMPGASAEHVPISASAVPAFHNPKVLCHELTKEEIMGLVHAFSRSAHRVVKAGFDIIEIHAHQGYLIDQFMTALWNKRSDEYGGDLKGRMRFALEIIAAIKSIVGTDFPLSFRYSGSHMLPGGRSLLESQKIAKILEEAGINVLHIDYGCDDVPQFHAPPVYYKEGTFVEFTASIKKAVKIPVITVGSIMTPVLAEQILNEGNANFVCLGRALLADPDWPNKAKEGKAEDIRPCIRCLEGCVNRRIQQKTISCSVNPSVGREQYYKITRTETPKKVMVVGGGPAGMEAARVAALRGHHVTLYEKDKELGGQLREASIPQFKKVLMDLTTYLSGQINKLGVEIVKGKEVTVHLVKREKPAALVIASGAVALIPPIPGIKSKKVVTAIDLLGGNKRAGDKVIVMGASLVGCETALYLAQNGKKVSIIKMRPGKIVAEDLNKCSQAALLEELKKAKVAILTDLTIKRITDNGMTVADNGKVRTLKADAVVLALGSKPDTLKEQLEDLVSETYVIGDCVDPRNIGEAIHEGFVAGWRI